MLVFVLAAVATTQGRMETAEPRQLQVTVHYPAAMLKACNATIHVASALASSFSGLPMAPGQSDEWLAAINYTGHDVGRRVVVTFELVLPFSSPLPSSSCLAVCPNLAYMARNLGAPNQVVLLERQTLLHVWPYFCQRAGSVAEVTVRSPALGNERRLFTYSPPGLVENPLTRPISLAVLHDGQIVPSLIPILDTLITTGDVQELVVVGVDSDDPKVPNYRGAILTPSVCQPKCICPPDSAWCRQSCAPGTSGNGSAYLSFLIDTALPTVRATLGISPTAANTASWGYSLGGLTAWYHAYTAPSVFGAVIAGSPSLWYNCGEVIPRMADIPTSSRVYIDVGDEEGAVMDIPATTAYEDLLSRGFKDGENAWLTLAAGDFHESNSFLMKMPRALKAVFPGSAGDMSHYMPPVLRHPAAE